MSDVDIRTSAIDRLGVYAGRAFRAGEIVLRWDTSQRVPRAEKNAMREQADIHWHPWDEQSFFLVRSPECYVDHSCDNNTVVQDFCDVAIRDIAAGEEISSDYDSDGAGLSFACHCGAKNCRGATGLQTEIP